MAKQIKVNTGRLNSDANKIQSAITRIKTEKSKLQNNAQQLDRMWDGPASDAFKKAFWDDMNALEQVIKDMESIQKYEVNAKKQYESCEQKVSQLIKSLRV